MDYRLNLSLVGFNIIMQEQGCTCLLNDGRLDKLIAIRGFFLVPLVIVKDIVLLVLLLGVI